MSDQPTNSELGVRVALLEQSLHEIRDNTAAMAGSLQSLTRLEERHIEMGKGIERAFQAIKETREDHQRADDELAERLSKIEQDRLAKIEQEMPLLRIARNLVFTFCGGCTLIVLLYIARLAGLWSGGSLPHP